MSPGDTFRLFVYGTLRSGGRFHERYCSGARSIVEATVAGRSSLLPEGYPVLDVPRSQVLAHGSADPLADVRRLETIEPDVPPAPGWPATTGELMVLDDPSRRLPALDELEGFDPGGPSLYLRVALPVRPAQGPPVVAWTYIRGR